MSVRDEAGFSLVELLVVTTIITVIMAGVFTALNPSLGSSQVQPEVADLQQRMRVGADVLHRDLVMAGAGTYSGVTLGSLVNFFAPILPYRIGMTSPDSPGTFRSDAITIMYVVPSAAQTTIRGARRMTSCAGSRKA
jgi:prepilin-type N-terminal cleavage/methylation domain-containing protein